MSAVVSNKGLLPLKFFIKKRLLFRLNMYLCEMFDN